MKKMVFALILGLLVVGCQPKTETVVIQGEKGERGERGEVGPRGESGSPGQYIYGNTGVIKLCTSSNGSSEYGIVIGGNVYAVMHNELLLGTSNTYLAKLSLGVPYLTTDGAGCSFTLTQTMIDSVNVIKSLYMVTKQCLKKEGDLSNGYEERTVLTDGTKFYEVDSDDSDKNKDGFKQITCE